MGMGDKLVEVAERTAEAAFRTPSALLLVLTLVLITNVVNMVGMVRIVLRVDMHREMMDGYGGKLATGMDVLTDAARLMIRPDSTRAGTLPDLYRLDMLRVEAKLDKCLDLKGIQ